MKHKILSFLFFFFYVQLKKLNVDIENTFTTDMFNFHKKVDKGTLCDKLDDYLQEYDNFYKFKFKIYCKLYETFKDYHEHYKFEKL